MADIRELKTLVFQTSLSMTKNKRDDAIRAFHYVLKELDKDEHIDNGSLTENLAAVYAYLLPRRAKVLPHAKLRNKTAWIAQACSTDASRDTLCGIQVDGRYSVATDGKRLHLIEVETCEADRGNFDPKTLKNDKSRFDTYPNYINVIPDYKNRYSRIETPKMKLLYTDMFVYHIEVEGFTISLDADHVDQALCAHSETLDFTLWYYDEYKTVVITYDEKIAILMPVR